MTNAEAVQKTEVEQIHEDASSPEVAVSAEGSLRIDGADELHAALEDGADGMDVTGFKCAKCGLAHMHDTNKHRTTDSSDMDVSDVDDMEYNSNCHCGYNEAAHRGIVGTSPDEAARQAPIPDDTRREMAEQF